MVACPRRNSRLPTKRQLRRGLIRRAAIDGCPDHPLFINVDPNELDQGWLVRPDDPLFFHDHPVHLEITESAPLDYFEQCRSVLTEVRDKGVSVIIVKEKCSLYAKGLKQLKGRAFKISDKCVNDRECINNLACPAFYLEDEKVNIDATMCVGCAICAQICPENAIIPVKD